MWGQYDLDTPFAGQGGDWSRGSDALRGMSEYGGKEFDTWLDPYLDQLGLGLLGAGMGGIPGQVSGVATDLAGRREGGQGWGQALTGALAGVAGGYLGIPGMGSASDWAFDQWGGESETPTEGPPPGFEEGTVDGIQENPWFGADTPSGGPGAEVDSNPWRSTGHWAPERGVDASRFLRQGFDPFAGFAGSAGDVLSGYNYDSFYGIDHFRV